MTDVLTQLCSELADLTERNARQDAALEDHVNLGVALCETLGVSEIDELPWRAEQYVDAVDGAYEKITAGAEKSGDPEKLGDRIDKALDEAYDRDGTYQRAADAPRRYMIRQGLPADPVRLDDPDLWALYEAPSDS